MNYDQEIGALEDDVAKVNKAIRELWTALKSDPRHFEIRLDNSGRFLYPEYRLRVIVTENLA